MLDAHNKWQRRQDETMAFWVANIMNTNLSKQITPKQLINLLYPEKQKTREEYKKEESEFFKQFKGVKK